MSWFRRDRSWAVVETASFPGRQDQVRIVEQDLTERGARRSAPEWQAASDRHRSLLVMRGSQLPTVVYTAERPTHDHR